MELETNSKMYLQIMILMMPESIFLMKFEVVLIEIMFKI